jgi:hypothetical protein
MPLSSQAILVDVKLEVVQQHLVLVQAEAALDLVNDAAAGTTVGCLILVAAQGIAD